MPVERDESEIVMFKFLACLILLAAANFSNAKDKSTGAAFVPHAPPEKLVKKAEAIRIGFDLNDPEQMFSYVLKVRELIQHGLDMASAYPDDAGEYQAALVPVTHDAAIDTWPGWKDAYVSDEYRLFGLQTARLNLKLREDLKQSPEKRSLGHWIVGLHLLANIQYQDAADSFIASRDLALEGNAEQTVVVAQGWIHLAAILAGKDQWDEFEAIKQQLAGMDDQGKYLASQFDSAIAKFKTN